MVNIDDLLRDWHKRSAGRQLFMGIGGGTGSGKSDVAEEIRQRLQPLDVEVVNQDRFFKPVEELPTYYSEFHRELRRDFNRPDSFKTEEMFAYCAGIRGHDVVILEGILALFYPELRRLMDVKCYVTVSLDEMLIRRTKRNLAVGYGGGFEEIAHYNLECVTRQHERYNAPTIRHADLVIPNGNDDSERREKILAALCRGIQKYKNNGIT